MDLSKLKVSKIGTVKDAVASKDDVRELFYRDHEIYVASTVEVLKAFISSDALQYSDWYDKGGLVIVCPKSRISQETAYRRIERFAAIKEWSTTELGESDLYWLFAITPNQ